MSAADAFLYVAAVFLPPIAVFIKRGCGSQLLLNIILDFLGWIPGILHAWYIIYTTPARPPVKRSKDDYYVDDRHSRRSHDSRRSRY